jgi:hypothetical protein
MLIELTGDGMFRLITICFCALMLAGGYRLTAAQSLASGKVYAQSNGSSSLDNSVNASVESATKSSVSASVRASVDSTAEGNQAGLQARSFNGASTRITQQMEPHPQAEKQFWSAYGSGGASLYGGGFANRSAMLRGYSRSDLSAASTRHASYLGAGAQAGASGHAFELHSFASRVKSKLENTPNAQHSGQTESAGYSSGFADSTKGTALISPPDLGTSSPLDWSPDLDFGFEDFESHTLLNPSLQSPSILARKRKRLKLLQKRETGTSLEPASMTPSSIGPASPMPDILNQPLLQSPLDQTNTPQSQ